MLFGTDFRSNDMVENLTSINPVFVHFLTSFSRKNLKTTNKQKAQSSKRFTTWSIGDLLWILTQKPTKRTTSLTVVLLRGEGVSAKAPLFKILLIRGVLPSLDFWLTIYYCWISEKVSEKIGILGEKPSK